jgi:hypothetical protein
MTNFGCVNYVGKTICARAINRGIQMAIATGVPTLVDDPI